jgi:hypothetical protein
VITWGGGHGRSLPLFGCEVVVASKVEICNLALFHLGNGKEIASIDERSQEAAVVRRFFDPALEAVLRDFDWPFATKIAALAQVSVNPNTEWKFSYRYPSDCINIRRVLSGTRQDTAKSKVPFKIAQGPAGILIFCDIEQASIEYTVLTTNTQLFPPDFTMALSYKLAAYIAPRVTGGDPTKLGPRALQLYEYEISKAKAAALNEEQPDLQLDSEFITARN